MVKFGVIGAGGISARFCLVLQKESGAELRAVAARDPVRAADFAAKYGAQRACSYEELVRDSDVDVVYIGTVHNRHKEQIKLCLENGKHVLCEKPMVLHEEDARECFALAREKNLLLVENMWPRSNPCVIQAREWVKAGRIGDVKLVNASFCFRAPYNPAGRLFDPGTAGGSVYDAGVYPIEFALGVLGEAPDSVASAYQTVSTGVDGSAAITLRFPGGALAALTCATTVRTPNDAVIYGTEGSIVVRDFLHPHDAVLLDADGNETDRVHADFDDGFSYQICHVIHLVESGATESDRIPPSDTIVCANIFDQIFKKTP